MKVSIMRPTRFIKLFLMINPSIITTTTHSQHILIMAVVTQLISM
ncbi:hypothetical protein QWY27_14885 [Zwartia sp. IMCC34845]|nr:hypothetical protein [Zwartia vadi]